jgi:hypothetical protein
MADETVPPSDKDAKRAAKNAKRRTPEERLKAAAQMRRWRQRNYEHHQTYQNEWHRKNADRVNANRRAAATQEAAKRQPKPELTAAEKKARFDTWLKGYRERNREQLRVKKRAYKAANRDRINAQRRERRAQPEIKERERLNELRRKEKPGVKEGIATRTKMRRLANLDEERAYEREMARQRRSTPEGRKRSREQARSWSEKNIDRLKEQRQRRRAQDPERYRSHDRERYAADPNFRLRKRLRDRIRDLIKSKGIRKAGSAVRDLGCSVTDFKTYIESLFMPGMTWQNHGNGDGKWNIDHRKPLVLFDLTQREQFLEACHFTNLQPLWWRDNLRKQRLRYED